ncbi:TM0106 family RecB-like putative nuclease [Rhodopirellula europaea]|uniref:RecB family nuclease n=1 Tax=Rhodopirellula europaea 6C TaxID=1263867 RepID=M2A665_9BACT|nr:TM0106 family RecB-like putative nuclease [Rhodopirellula europaea]EMB16036.1 RecB family nuclease [Rhodopirellula europaea 6C]
MKKIDSVYTHSATDLADFLACQYATSLAMRRADGDIEIPFRHNARLERLIEKGHAHEAAYLEMLKSDGLNVVELRDFDDHKQVQATVELMRRGVDVIYQGSLAKGSFAGRSDFLIRVPRASDLGGWSYEVVDTKLAHDTKAGTILQLCLYSDCVCEIQGTRPKTARAAKPAALDSESTFEEECFSLDAYWAYFELVKRQYLDATSKDRLHSLYPEPCQHCDICRWFPHCDRIRRDDDHLSFVAGIQASQIDEIRRQGNATLQGFAESDDPIPERPKGGSRESIFKAHRQAKVQLQGRASGERIVEYLPVAAVSDDLEHDQQLFGFCRLPQPSAGDVYLDFEGDPHAPDGVLEYLFGYVSREGDDSTYHSDWCLKRADEGIAFGKLMQFLLQCREQFPDFHIYHFAPYEPAAMKRMAMRHQLYEADLDELLRSNTFVDLYAVVRQSMVLSVESYSIKKLEAFYDFDRKADLSEVRSALSEVEFAIELNGPSLISQSAVELVEAYNRDDCVSTLKLHQWLELQRQVRIDSGIDIPRPPAKSGDAGEKVAERDAVFGELRDRLKELAGDSHESEVQQARWLMAHLLEYFFREDKTVFWEKFRHMSLEDDDLLFENAAISGLEFVEQREPTGRGRIPTSVYRFPPQEHTVGRGKKVLQTDGQTIGTIVEIDRVNRTVEIKKTGKTIDVHPTSVFVFDYISPEPMPENLLELGQEVAEDYWNPAYVHSSRYDLIARCPPSLQKVKLPCDGDDISVALQIAEDMDSGVFPIQGPPGSGKTYVGANMVVELARRGYRIGVTAVGHNAITNLLIRAASFDTAGEVSFAQKTKPLTEEGSERIQILKTNPTTIAPGTVVGGTAWLWSRDDMCQKLDYLFIDEAGQMSLAQSLAVARAAKNVVLLGDPQQLEQPQSAAHPEGADVAVLGHLIGDDATIPQDRGLFLAQTRRLHPAVCKFTSEQFYDGRLTSHPDCENNEILGEHAFSGSGLRLLTIDHNNNQNRSDEEVEAVQAIVAELHRTGASWKGSDGCEASITADDILVVAPYNAQVDAIAEVVGDRARVGTVDKFQGQEAPIVIYSTTSSSADDAPRGMEFLYDPHRLNVATSRSKCMTIMVASPKLFHPRCTTPKQMKLANAFCRFAELAKPIAGSSFAS